MHINGIPPSGKSADEIIELVRQTAYQLQIKTVKLDHDEEDDNEEEEDLIHPVVKEEEGAVSLSPSPTSRSDSKWQKWWPIVWYAWLEFGPSSPDPHHIWAISVTSGPSSSNEKLKGIGESRGDKEKACKEAAESQKQEFLQEKKLSLLQRQVTVSEVEAKALATNSETLKRKQQLDELKAAYEFESDEDEKKIIKKRIKSYIFSSSLLSTNKDHVTTSSCFFFKH